MFKKVLFALLASISSLSSDAPSWVEDGVVYSIFPRDFSPTGDLPGVTEKLGDLKKLGVSILWLLPIHPIGQKMKKGTIGSPYSIRDYYAIDPVYGTKADLKKLVAKTHELEMKIILDAVVNHTAWDSVMMKQPEFYLHDAKGNIIPPVADWYDVAALDYNNPHLRAYILDMLKYWLKEFDLDGFRCDAAGMVPLDFWVEVRTELQKIKPDILLLAEGDNPEAMVKAFNLDYAWKFEGVLSDVLENGAPATASLKAVLEYEKKAFPPGSLHLRFSDNHDKARAVVRFGAKGALAASALIFTINGVPMIYNGMEVGDSSESTAPALFEKIPIFWKTAEIRPQFFPFYQQMIAMRKEHPVLRDGEMVWLENSESSRIVTYLRKSKEETFFIAINFSNQPFTGTVSGSKPLSLKAWESSINRVSN